ncbi:helix-turn-helix transcriptional regulator [Aeromonas hydrophila]|uniref:helix-turn-helix transcriptional regulator n=1 Tax=Aeromonas hydrophila TaxID=644 RepID=UPI000492ED93|nr:helix-turn-helix transcriptional regulator [Aeromonas hydrophila]HAT1543759.1 helix-turn-helix transcriptional regulator [Aeromonas hydrophila]HAT1554227.1 helix-turn-helix transcriptional regulator [Aeromonas hydrophila]
MSISNSDPVDVITQELGARLQRVRLNLNITQAALAELAGVTRKKVIHAETGNVDLTTLVKLMRAMNIADHLDSFLPPVPISPIQLAQLAGKERRRASGTPGEPSKQESSEW